MRSVPLLCQTRPMELPSQTNRPTEPMAISWAAAVL